MVSNDFSSIIYRSQNVHSSPSIHYLNLKNKVAKEIHQSNPKLKQVDLRKPQFLNYSWGNNELSGALIYPSNFNPSKKYPMIVFIYEKASVNTNVFNPPSNYSYIGFNALNYVTDDYFVFYPDISYKAGAPGISALNCVKSGVNEVLKLGYVDAKKIGLYGHSFGGYESAFIATQTDMFAAIVAGAPATNLTSHYHGVGWNFNRPEIWRYESQQWRMGVSFYDNKEAYWRNSPLQYAENIQTPLLLWTGKQDFQVHWMQSIEMFIALKRLNKNCKLLLFENEGHSIKNGENQLLLSKEIKRWFDFHCK
jgi:dipeptidyl aminopeptidase/acylaminoacyl peptidase